MKTRIIDREIIRDIAEGMGKDSLMQKYQVSHDQLQGILDRLSVLRQKRIDSMVSDLKYGMSRTDFMQKYGLRPGGLIKVLNTLISERIVNEIRPSGVRTDLADAPGNNEPWLQKCEHHLVRLFPRNRDKLRRTA
jgi:hypothetical protein